MRRMKLARWGWTRRHKILKLQNKEFQFIRKYFIHIYRFFVCFNLSLFYVCGMLETERERERSSKTAISLFIVRYYYTHFKKEETDRLGKLLPA